MRKVWFFLYTIYPLLRLSHSCSTLELKNTVILAETSALLRDLAILDSVKGMKSSNNWNCLIKWRRCFYNSWCLPFIGWYLPTTVLALNVVVLLCRIFFLHFGFYRQSVATDGYRLTALTIYVKYLSRIFGTRFLVYYVVFLY